MSWFREMGGLLCDYWRADRAYRAAMRELRKEVKRLAKP